MGGETALEEEGRWRGVEEEGRGEGEEGEEGEVERSMREAREPRLPARESLLERKREVKWGEEKWRGR